MGFRPEQNEALSSWKPKSSVLDEHVKINPPEKGNEPRMLISMSVHPSIGTTVIRRSLQRHKFDVALDRAGLQNYRWSSETQI